MSVLFSLDSVDVLSNGSADALSLLGASMTEPRRPDSIGASLRGGAQRLSSTSPEAANTPDRSSTVHRIADLRLARANPATPAAAEIGQAPYEAEMMALDTLVDGVWILGMDGEVRYRNTAAAAMERFYWHRSGRGGSMRELFIGADTLPQLLQVGRVFGEYQLSESLEGPDALLGQSIGVEMQVLRCGNGRAAGISLHARHLRREWHREQYLQDRHVELKLAQDRLKETQMQLLQSEKMAAIGQLAAGIAHEINNPVGYVFSNMSTLQSYTRGLLVLLEAYDRLGAVLPETERHLIEPIDEIKGRFDYPFLQQDLPQLVEESREGIERVKKLAQDLRDFSHHGDSGQEAWALVDLHRGLESTLNIVWNELKYKAEVHRDYGELTTIECMPTQINHVFLNLLVNAGRAISHRGEIVIRTRQFSNEVCISISDSAESMAAGDPAGDFDRCASPIPVAHSADLGLSTSYAIIRMHGGRIEVESSHREGTTFNVFLPIRQTKA